MATDSTATTQSAPTDATLIAAARRGETASYRVLVGRHQDAGARLARRLAPTTPAELLSDAIAEINVGLRSGAGPRTAFRTHLLTVVHRTASDSGKGRRNRREETNNTVLGIDPALLAVATRSYRALPESQQVALWHTEVDGDPLLDTGVLLGVSGTEIAELAFAGREVLRHALLESHLEKIAAGPCRWTTDRLGAFLRARLNPANTEKVATHLKTCSVCFTALPAVRLVETELQALVATIVLGPAAALYLGREVPRQARRPVAVGAMAAAPAFLISHGKAAAFLGLGAALVTGGLIGGTNLMDSDDTPTAAVGGTFNLTQTQSQGAQSPTQSVPTVTIADSGSGVAGGSGGVGSGPTTDGQHQSDVASASTDTAATATAPRPLVRTEGPTPKVSHSTSQTGTPAAASNGSGKQRSTGSSGEESDAPTLHLGFTDIAITPGSGFLWLFSFSHGR